MQIIEHCARLWPHKIKGEGHFVAKLIKTAPTAETKVKETSLKKKQQFKDFYLFEQQFLQTKPFPRLSQLGNQLYSLPAECPDLNGIKVLRAGLHLGELKKNRFEPNHALALALQPKECRQTHYLTTQSTDWLKFLKGETLKGTGQKGWVLVTIDGFSLGWGKEVKGILKTFTQKD